MNQFITKSIAEQVPKKVRKELWLIVKEILSEKNGMKSNTFRCSFQLNTILIDSMSYLEINYSYNNKEVQKRKYLQMDSVIKMNLLVIEQSDSNLLMTYDY
ncbi:hypothetical protein VQ049_06500 [Staphylococcus arlettae]|uniref:hypothetical protein n=1 Tax=Staphylococcus arlettae TaxID=29378 RepID=UPI003CF44B41